MLWVGTALCVLLGYVLLAAGGTTAPAALLVVGYVILAPLAIAGVRFRRKSAARIPGATRTAPADSDRAPYEWAAAVSALVLALYAATLAPTTAMWDASEYIAAAKVLGLPHPPGNPLFILIAHVFGALPIAPTYAERINLLAATASALSAGIWFLFAHEVTRRMFDARWARIASAAACATLGAVSFTVWNQSVVNEKVYTLALVQMTVVVWLLVRWIRRPAGAAADRLLLVIAFLLALGYTIHPAGYLAAPCVLAAVLMHAPRTVLRGRMVGLVLSVTLLGMSPFAFEVIRAAYHPAINEGEPTACTDGFALRCSLSLDTIARLKSNLAREQYGKPRLSDRQAPFGDQLSLWWLYFRWQWLRDPHGVHPTAQLVLALLAAALAIAGARTHARTAPESFMPFATLIFTVTVALVFYLNFKYTFSQSPELGGQVAREPRDRDYFFLWSFSAVAVWVGLGAVTLWRELAARVRSSRALAVTAPAMAAVVLFPLAVNWRDASRAGDTFTRDFAFDMLDSVAPNGVLITAGDNDTFPLWYAQQVEGHRRDVVVVISTYLGTLWFPRQLMRSGVAVAASPEEADTVPDYIRLDKPQLFEAGAIRATVPAGYLTRDQLFELQIVRDVLPKRPIYFTNLLIPRSLGLDPYLVVEGLALRLKPELPAESGDVVNTGRGYVDIRRSLALWRENSRGRSAFLRQGDWIDGASLGMPGQYVLAGAVLAEALQRRGDAATAKAVDADVRALLATGGLSAMFSP
jgi:transmembrane protein TMEM260 (protein O-mannosyltransferase)